MDVVGTTEQVTYMSHNAWCAVVASCQSLGFFDGEDRVDVGLGSI